MESNKILFWKENPTTNFVTNSATNTSHNLKLPWGLIIKWKTTNVLLIALDHNFYIRTLHNWKPKLGEDHDDNKVIKNVKRNWN